MDYNYHTHTHWCDHATGTPEEYIQIAIAGGIKHMGFSDHAPWIFPDGYESHFRVPMARVGDYFAELRQLREKYRDQIELHIGFEMEYYPAYFEAMLENAKRVGAEYLILGQHFLANEHPGGHGSQRDTDSEEKLAEYVATVIKGIQSGVFTYVAHPDIFKFSGDREAYRREMRKICVASREYNVPLEINFLGIRQGRNYPDEAFWEMAGQEQCTVTFGCDAHEATSAYDGKSLAKARQLVEKFDLNYIGRPIPLPLTK